MKYPNILNSSAALFVVVVGCFTLLLAPCCLAVAINDEGLPRTVSVPFNDLLPPLSDAEFEKQQTSAINTNTANISTTTKKPLAILAPALKPTKSLKSQQIKKIQQQKNQQQLELAVPVLDLNPEVPPSLNVAEEAVASVAVTDHKQAASTQHLQHIKGAQAKQGQYQTLQQQLKPQKQQLQKQQQQQKQQLEKQLQQQQSIQTKQINIEHLQQLLHSTTRRPSRGALPTLTPFPRRFK